MTPRIDMDDGTWRRMIRNWKGKNGRRGLLKQGRVLIGYSRITRRDKTMSREKA